MADNLERYHQKRHFDKTSEPEGDIAKGETHVYMIQKHDATRLHYDFRLELGGTLKSWAVTRGPSLNPADKRLAVHVEDHPLSYASFEGTIPHGQYGGGTVMLWDRGSWEAVGDAASQYEKGRMDFILHGERLKGLWHLVRMHSHKDDKDNWLLMKGKDEWADTEHPDIVIKNYMTSIATGRTMNEIAAGHAKKNTVAKLRVNDQPMVFPNFIEPQLATLADKPPIGKNWLHEIKFDGYRMIARKDGVQVKLLTRKGLDWTHKFPNIAREIAALPVTTVMLDGEIVVLDEQGITDFSSLQLALSQGKTDVFHYYLFDLLYINGQDASSHPLHERKELLATLLAAKESPHLLYSDHVDNKGTSVLGHACQLSLEGIVSKRSDLPYHAGRSMDWIKTKCIARQEFVIGGYMPAANDIPAVGSLLLGYYEEEQLIYAGKAGTGFTDEESHHLFARFEPMITNDNPFVSVPALARKNAQWIKPVLIAEISFAEWTAGKMVRHAVYHGLREDKPADEVVIEKPSATTDAETPIAITHPDRVLYPDIGLTKGALAHYYDTVSEWMLPHIGGRPLSIIRCPDGISGSCFFQRHKMQGLSSSVEEVPIESGKHPGNYMMVNDREGIIALLQMGAIEFHPWGSKAEDIAHADRLVFDLDPDEGLAWKYVVAAALDMRQRLQSLHLTSFLKTTGGKGLHLVVPIAPRYEWEQVKQFCKMVAQTAAEEQPERYTASISKASRQGKLFIDYLRNEQSATAVAPYSVRARPGAPVATPLHWDELSASQMPSVYNVDSVPRRLAHLRDDPWEGMGDITQALPL